jgi:SagB-type dehydrogenase family enzyme
MILDETLGADSDAAAWELYHENSKVERHARLGGLAQSADIGSPTQAYYADRPGVPLGEIGDLHAPLGTAMRIEMRLRPGRLSRKALSTLLAAARGIGEAGLAPFEIFFHTGAALDEAAPGLYVYDRAAHAARLLRRGDRSAAIAEALLVPDLVARSAAVFFIAASFGDAIARWDERGYRLTLISAGGVARELGLVAAAMGLGTVVTGAFYDREIDRLLGLDGVARSTLLVIAVGAQGREQRVVMGEGSEALG